HIEIENLDESDEKDLNVSWEGSRMLKESSFSFFNNQVQILFNDREHRGSIQWSNSDVQATISDSTYHLDEGSIIIPNGGKWSTTINHTFCFSTEEMEQEQHLLKDALNNPQNVFDENREIWDLKTSRVINSLKPEYASESYQRIAVKCLMTLNNNWRSKAGFLNHDGLFPSYNYEWFHGFWAWDSWKHAVAIAHYDEELAKEQIRAMYDFQDDYGMIADCVYRDTIIENHNWRNTKPPLSGWAIWKVFKKSQDTSFLREMYPKLIKYHNWWYAYRDHNDNGLCEYGSTDGSLIAAKWESGMDNAVRFDDATIVENNVVAWSLDMESVDLNAYLAAEKEYLGKIAEALNLEEESTFYFTEAENLSDRIRDEFFHDETGWFYDIKTTDRSFLQQYAAEGWIPLWTRIASHEQALQVAETMLDTSHFNTYVPFPILTSNHPKFKPDRGYWRGPVWLDQVYFGIKGLEYNGFTEDAKVLTHKVLKNLEGLKDDDGPIWENYHPHSGKGMESRHFSWSAAHILLLMVEE
ncbi:MAG: trehalase, partial [Saprospiraceae bacterium]|nr:trehalase [Saprospiraceae bacterium]